MKNEYEKSNAELARVIHALIAKYYKHARYNSKVDESVTEPLMTRPCLTAKLLKAPGKKEASTWK